MHLVEFPEQTVVIAKDQPEYLPLPAHRFVDDPQGRIAFCWKLTWRERLAVLFHGKLWHQVLTFNQPLQPQLMSVEKPEMPEPPLWPSRPVSNHKHRNIQTTNET